MKLGIMQPYFFPYIGYWQLINAVDTYVVYDDVNFIKGGWINRNRILAQGNPQYINITLENSSSNKKINEIKISNIKLFQSKILKTLNQNYKRAPFFEPVISFLETTICYKTDSLSEYLFQSIKSVCSYLNISTNLILSSTLEKNNQLKGQEKVLEICTLLRASEYYNAIGGIVLYDHEKFLLKGVKLSFLRTSNIQYCQLNHGFVPNLSIIDVMMYNSLDNINHMLTLYSLE